jgi:hypothetical protein
MDISSLIKVIFDPQLNRSGWMRSMVKPGDMFNLKIVAVKDNGRILVDFGKFRALAEITFPVKTGDELLAKVTDAQGQLRLRLIDPDSKAFADGKNSIRNLEIISADIFNKIQSDVKLAAGQILNLPDSRMPPQVIGEALAALKSHFESIDLNKDVTTWLPLLKSCVENAGYFFEKKLADAILKLDEQPKSQLARVPADAPEIKLIFAKDLKPILMLLKEYIEGPDSGSKLLNIRDFSSFKNTLEMLLADIVNQQTRAIHKHELPEPHQVFACSIPVKDKRQTVALKVYCPKKKKNGSSAGFKISVLLEMERIGEIRADFFLLKKDLTITFFIKDKVRKKQFEDNLAEIHEALAPFFDYLILKTVVAAKKVRDFHHEDSNFSKDRQIDLKI